ncbi:exported hypothetical protein [uncultured Desulfobacterium sp.]|uniref:DUF1573 domain-containing protein n=1 Tax=uncultured Desulfobacterium sp. TaxID=201089 RepID=A0A445MSH0_9BACT|nr:exported hypothetical protein [uncultured Desulfobacterium sp.]
MSHLVSLSVRFLLISVLGIGLCISEVISAEQPANIGTSAIPNAPQGAPKIQFDEMTHHFGKVSQQTTLEHTFVFKNIGAANLHIKDVKAG